MTGWRVGYGAGPKDLIQLMIKVQSQETTNTCTISQYAAIEALNGPQDSVEIMRQAFAQRRRQIVDRLNTILGFQCDMPQGAFYVFPDVTQLFGKSCAWGTLKNDIDVCNFLLDKARVACVPGVGFGAPGYLRFSYAAASEQITNAMARIEEAVSQLI
jgi:aspartate aminotransferase